MCRIKRKKLFKKVPISNKRWNYSKQELQKIYNLMNEMDWLLPRESQLRELMFDLLQRDVERDLIQNLLRKVVFLSDDDSREMIRTIAHVITNDWGCAEDDTVIVGAKKNDRSDGADVFIYGLRNNLDWRESRFKTTYNGLTNMQGLKNIIIADDFTGTGLRMDKTIKVIEASVPNCIIRFVSIGLMESVARKHHPSILTYEHFAPVIVSPGLNHEKDKRVQLMSDIELYLALNWKGLFLEQYHLGFEESGALYWNKQFRVPNNVYPIFWWGEKKDGKPIDALMSM